MDIPHELVEQFTRTNGVVFIGAGTSIGAGLPGWGDLIKRLASELDDCPPNASYPDIAKYYILAHGRNRLVTRLRQELDTFNLKPTIVHNLLVNLPINYMFTTNYDDLLEQALRELDRKYNLIVRNVDVGLRDMDRLQLVKLHGDLSQPDTIIIASCDYEQYFYENPALARLLIVSLQTCTILFLGSSVTDSNFRYMLTQARNEAGNLARNSFILTFNPNKWDVKDLGNSGIRVIDLELDNESEYKETDINEHRNKLLENWLQEFNKRIQTERSQQTKKPKLPHKKLPSEPYKFLDYFTSKDATIFFGRQQEIEKMINLVLAYRLTILYGESGTGKTSLLQAAVLPHLKENGKYLIVYARPLSKPLSELKKALLSVLPHKLEKEEEQTISLLNIVEKALPEGSKMLIVLDQFEEFFIRQGEVIRVEFIQELIELLNTSNSNLHCLISLRSDYLHRLDELEIPLGKDPLLHRMRLYTLGSEAASEAITKPMEAFKIPFDSMLVEKLAEDLREVEIAPVQLQIVCFELWQDWKDRGEPVDGITLDRYLELGKTDAFLANYLDDVIEKLENPEVRNDYKLELDGESAQKTARAILKSMVTSEQTKVAVNIREITQHEILNKLAVPEVQAKILLKYLLDKRVIRQLQFSKQYELAHEVMVEKIWKWLNKEEQHLLDLKDILAAAMNSYSKFKTLVPLEQMNLLTEQAEQLSPNSDELELLLKSSIKRGTDTKVWIMRTEASDAVNIVNILSKQLESATTSRPQIAKALSYTHASKALRSLNELLLDKNDDVQRAAAKALGDIKVPEAIHVLYRAIKGETKLNRAARIIDALEQDASIEAVNVLVDIASEHPNKDVCLRAANALSHLNLSININTLIDQLSHNNSTIREVSSNTLKGRTKEVLDELKVMLNSNDLQAQLKAVGALETIGYARAKDLIIDALYNENPLIREKSVNILGLSGDKTVVNLLFDQLSDQNINVLKASLKALHSLLKDSMTEDLHNKDLQKRKQVVKALGAMNEDWVLESLKVFLHDEDSEVRQQTVQSLSQLDDERVIESLIACLQDEDNEVCLRALQALIQSGRNCLEVIEDNDEKWSVVWLELWDKGKDEEAKKLSEYARAWLKRTLNKTDGYRGLHPGWSYVWQQIIEDSPDDRELLQLGCDWLEVAKIGCTGWSYVWLPVINQLPNDDNLFQLGHDWLIVAKDDDESWGVVWPILWEQAKDQDENAEILKERARVWLRQIIDKHRGVHPGWSHVWRAILKDNQNDEGLLKLGFDWLESAQDEDKGWGFVWLRLMDLANNKNVEEKLVKHAQTWLRQIIDKYSDDFPAWSDVWHELDKKKYTTKEMLSLDEKWLTLPEAIKNSNWHRMFENLLNCGSCSQDLLEKGYQWLDENIDHPEWSYTYYKLQKYYDKESMIPDVERNDKLLSLAEEWLMLPSTTDNPEWPYKCECVLDHGKFSFGLLEKCRQLLEKNKDHYNYKGNWGFVYAKLLKYHMTDEEKALIANNLFTDPRWPYVWKAMWNPERPERRLAEDARNWLDQNQDDQSGVWITIWGNIWDSKPGDEKIKNLGERWIKNETSINNLGFASVYLRIGEPSMISRDSFFRLGYQYLKKLSKRHRKWEDLYQFLWDKNYKRDQLASLKNK